MRDVDPCPPPRLLTAAGLAALLGLSLRQVWRLRAAGQLPPPVRLGLRAVRWRDADVADFLRGL